MLKQGKFNPHKNMLHSYTIWSIGEEDTIRPYKGVISLKGDKFLWDWNKTNRAFRKANYLVTIVRNPILIEQLKKVIKAHTGIEVIINVNYEKMFPYQFLENYYDVFESDETLHQFLFNKDAWLYIGDGCTPPSNNFYDAPNTVYTHELCIDIVKGNNITFKLKEGWKEEELEKAIRQELYHSDLRYNYTKIMWEFHPNYSMSEEDYAIYYHFTNKVDTKNRLIPFTKQSNTLIREIYNMCPTTLKEIGYNDIHPKYGVSCATWCNNKEEELLKSPENILYVPYIIKPL